MMTGVLIIVSAAVIAILGRVERKNLKPGYQTAINVITFALILLGAILGIDELTQKKVVEKNEQPKPVTLLYPDKKYVDTAKKKPSVEPIVDFYQGAIKPSGLDMATIEKTTEHYIFYFTLKVLNEGVISDFYSECNVYSYLNGRINSVAMKKDGSQNIIDKAQPEALVLRVKEFVVTDTLFIKFSMQYTIFKTSKKSHFNRYFMVLNKSEMTDMPLEFKRLIEK
jgi:hypothetical protein